jgi:hypothetical protein
MSNVQRAIDLLAARDAERKANRKPEDMFFAASRSAGRMGLEEGQKLNFAERMKEYRSEIRKRGNTFQDNFQRNGGRDHLKALQEISKTFKFKQDF